MVDIAGRPRSLRKRGVCYQRGQHHVTHRDRVTVRARLDREADGQDWTAVARRGPCAGRGPGESVKPRTCRAYVRLAEEHSPLEELILGIAIDLGESSEERA